MADVKSPGVAAVLSLLIPGVGQIYNGDFLRGDLLADRHAGVLVRHWRHARLGLPSHRRGDGLQPRAEEES